MGVWIVFEIQDDEDAAILGIAGVYGSEGPARECESATVDVPRGTRREADHWGIQSAYKGESRMC